MVMSCLRAKICVASFYETVHSQDSRAAKWLDSRHAVVGSPLSTVATIPAQVDCTIRSGSRSLQQECVHSGFAEIRVADCDETV